MKESKLPSNIRQIGNISDGIKIYIEDFVYTYLNQYAEAGDYCEKIAFLVGNMIKIGGDDVLFISGTIQGRYTIYEDGVEIFGEKSFEYAEEQIEKYFDGMDIVGWMKSQPGYGARLNPAYETYHHNNFAEKRQVMFILDPVEKLSAFYAANGEGLRELGGYFIYYDKNAGMQEYMLQNRLSKYKIKESAEPKGDDEIDFEGEPREKKPARRAYSSSYVARARTSFGDRPKRDGGFARAKSYDGRRMINMLATLSAVLFVICFIMGAGLIQNENRITALEDDMNNLSVSYSFMQEQLKQASQAVFAGNENALASATASPTEPPATSAANTPTEPPTAPPLNNPLDAPEYTETPTEPPAEAPLSFETQPPSEAPPDTEAPTQSPNSARNDIPETYIVESGDSLSYISQLFYGTQGMIDEIMRENGMTDPNTLYAGKELRLPRPDAAAYGD